MKKKLLFIFILQIALCAVSDSVRAQDFGSECDCTPPPPPVIPPPPENYPIPTYPVPPSPPSMPDACVLNPCLCNPQSCGIPPTPSGCQQDPCSCYPGQCAPYTGTTPNPPLPQATTTVAGSLTPAEATVEYVSVTAPTGSIFSFGSLGIEFAVDPQTNTLNAEPGGGTAANPWNVTSWVAGSPGEIYTQLSVINSNAPDIIAFTIICQLTPSGSSVSTTESINVIYTMSTNSCVITEN